MTVAVTAALNDARLQAVANWLDTGSGNAAVRIYPSPRPATPADTPTTAMLAQISLTKPCGALTNGVLTLTPEANGLIAETGTATWARIVNGNGDTAFDCDCGTGPGAWEVQLPQATLYAGGAARITIAVLG